MACNVIADAILSELDQVARRPLAHPALQHDHQLLAADAWPDGLPRVSHGRAGPSGLRAWLEQTKVCASRSPWARAAYHVPRFTS